MLRRPLVAALVLPLAAAVPAHAATHDASAARSHRLAVTGFAYGGTPARTISASSALTTVTVDGVSITADGSGVEKPYASLLQTERTAHRQGLRAELLFSNYSNRLQDFDTRAGHRLLASKANRAHLATTMARYVRQGGWDGVNIDLEIVQARDAAHLVQLARALQSAMPARKTVSVDVGAATSADSYRQQGFSLTALGRAVDVVQLMAYDQHGPGWSGPGPIGALSWQKKALEVVLTMVPAAKVDLGQAGYGYDWPTQGTGHELTDVAARRLVREDGADAVWHAAQGEWSASLSDGTRLWWADGRSFQIRKKLASAQHLHGMAVWRLGASDPLT